MSDSIVSYSIIILLDNEKMRRIQLDRKKIQLYKAKGESFMIPYKKTAIKSKIDKSYKFGKDFVSSDVAFDNIIKANLTKLETRHKSYSTLKMNFLFQNYLCMGDECSSSFNKKALLTKDKETGISATKPSEFLQTPYHTDLEVVSDAYLSREIESSC